MVLKFLGRGASFNPKEGNNSAYFVENKELFLIDCGESTFQSLIKSGLLDEIEVINLMITHTHSDHVGSLGSLTMYTFYNLNKPLNIILPNNTKYICSIEQLLKIFGCNKNMYKFIEESAFDGKIKTFQSIRYVETKHCADLACYGLVFNMKNGIVYYSGDTNETSTLKKLLSSSKQIDKLYIETTSVNFSGNPHLYIELLEEVISEDLKNKVYCMHINDDVCIERAKELGFNVVEVYKVEDN